MWEVGIYFSLRPLLSKRPVKNFIHQCGIDRVHGRRLVEGRCGLSSLNKSDRLSNASSEVVINHQARLFAHRTRSIAALLKMFSRERTHDQPAGALQGWHARA